MTTTPEADGATNLLAVVADLLRGEQHTRQSIHKRTGKSLPTADRWIDLIVKALKPSVRRRRHGKTTSIVYEGRREAPSKTATVGACVAASLASLFEGSAHERNLKDARDYMLRSRGDAYDDLDRKFFFAPKGGEYALPESREELDEIVDALLDNKMVSFLYRHNDGQKDHVTVSPLTLVIFDHQFYLLALRADGSQYCYRFARMTEVDGSYESFTYPQKSGYDPRNVFASTFGIHISNQNPVEDVEVLLTGPWANYATQHRWHPTQVARPEGERVRVTLRVRLCPEVETWVLGFGEHALVVKPEALRSAVAGRLRNASELYAPGDHR